MTELLINWHNQTKFALPVARIKKRMLKILNQSKLKGNFELGVKLVRPQTIKRLNQKYRQVNQATDVLSFPTQRKISRTTKLPLNNLGDIIICPRQAERYLQESRSIPWQTLPRKQKVQTLQKEIEFLIQHGFLHLLGKHHC